MLSSLTTIIVADIISFVEHQSELMFNEGDFQLQLSVYLLKSGHYDDVQVEYYLPNELAAMAGYDWDSNLYLDIVVRKDEYYCPIELKYPTKRVVKDAKRFGEKLSNVQLMRNQGAQDIVRYNFWKDVRRGEIVKALFPKVTGALAVMLTNDESYTRPVRPSSACYPFRTTENAVIGPGLMDWNGLPAMRDSHVPFHLDGKYIVKWDKYLIENEVFYITIIQI
jgi:hypothetical protein